MHDLRFRYVLFCRGKRVLELRRWNIFRRRGERVLELRRRDLQHWPSKFVCNLRFRHVLCCRGKHRVLKLRRRYLLCRWGERVRYLCCWFLLGRRRECV